MASVATFWGRCLLTLAPLLTAAAGLWAQSGGAEVRLTVKDPSGAVMQASGKLQSTADGKVYPFETGTQGGGTVHVPPGRYRLDVWRSGFAVTIAYAR